MNNKITQLFTHTILFCGVLLMIVPIWVIFVSSTHDNITIVAEGMKWTFEKNSMHAYDIFGSRHDSM